LVHDNKPQKSAYQRYGNDQGGNNDIQTHKEVVQTTDSAIEVAQRMLD
jgi:hypothetical protein